MACILVGPVPKGTIPMLRILFLLDTFYHLLSIDRDSPNILPTHERSYHRIVFSRACTGLSIHSSISILVNAQKTKR